MPKLPANPGGAKSSGGTLGSLPSAAPKKKKTVWDNSFVKGGIGVAAGVGEILGRPGQTVLGGINAARNEHPAGLSVMEGAYAGMTGLETYQPDEAIYGRKFEGRGAGTARFGLSVLSDPTTFLTMGTGKAAGVGAQAVGKTAAIKVAKEGGDEVAQTLAAKVATDQVRKQGLKKTLSSNDLDEAMVKEVLVEQALAKGVNPRRSLSQVVRGVAKGDAADGAGRYADNILSQTAARGKGGLILSAPFSRRGVSLVSDAQLDSATKFLGIDAAKTALAQTGLAKGAARAFVPGAKLTQASPTLGKAIHQASRGREEEVDLIISDAVRQADAAAKQIPEFHKYKATINDALEQGDDGLERLARDHPELMPAAEPLFQARNQAEALLDETARNGQLPIHSVLNKTRSTRILSKQGERALRDQSQAGRVAEALGVTTDDVLGSQHQLAQKIEPGLSTAAANAKISQRLQDAGLLKPGKSFFEQDAAKTTVAHIKSIADQVATAKQVKTLSELSENGVPIMLREGATNVPASYVPVNMGPLGKFHVPAYLRNELRHVTAVIENDPELKQFNRLMQGWTGLWKQSATTLPVGGAFTARNARSNVFLNYMAGVKNPAHYRDAMKIQKAVGRAEGTFSGRIATGAKRSKELVSETASGDFMKVVERELDNPRLFQAYKEAREHGAITSSYAAQDLGAGMTQKNLGLEKVKALGAIPRFGKRANQRVEDNARLAHFIAKKDELGDAAEAAASVKKFLYDYGDLTPAERKIKQSAIPFYTFMRKNTPLVVEQIIKNPGKFTAREHFANMFGTEVTSDTEGAPNYLLGEQKLNNAISLLVGGGGGDYVSTDDTPLAAAGDALTPVMAGLGAIPGVGKAIPDSMKAQDKPDLARKIIKPFSGAQLEAAKYVIEEATGKSLFTGGNIQGQNSYERLGKAAFPAVGRGKGVTRPVWDEEERKAALLTAITGVRLTRITPAQKRELDKLEADIEKTTPPTAGRRLPTL